MWPSLVERLLWAKSPSAACGGCSEGICVQWSADEEAAPPATKLPGTANRATKAAPSECCFLIIYSTYPGVAQLVARLLWEQDAASSSLATRTIKAERAFALSAFIF